ncbi:MAG: hypothetical protein K6V97_03570 [Actinomycetia bacterium]|nr:hypothetical protein [Actinomycetes bacterium]
MALTIRLDPPLGPDALKALWDRVPRTRGRDPEAVMRAVQGSALVATAWEDDRLVGAVRVITDGVYYAALCDLVWDPAAAAEAVVRPLLQAAVAPFLGRNFRAIVLLDADAEPELLADLGFEPSTGSWRRVHTAEERPARGV